MHRWDDAERVHLDAAPRHGVLADGEAGATVIGPETLLGAHGRERRGLAGFLQRGEQRADGEDGALRMSFAEPHAADRPPLRARELVEFTPILDGIRYIRRDPRLFGTVLDRKSVV